MEYLRPFHKPQFHFIQLMNTMFSGINREWRSFLVHQTSLKDWFRPWKSFLIPAAKHWTKSTCPAQNTSPHVASKSFQSRHQLQPASLSDFLLFTAPEMLLSSCFPSASPSRFDLVVYRALYSVCYLRSSQDTGEHFQPSSALSYQDNNLTCPRLHGATRQFKGFQQAPVNLPVY